VVEEFTVTFQYQYYTTFAGERPTDLW
jgi:hypothetical protein